MLIDTLYKCVYVGGYMITRKEMTRMLLKEGLLSCLENHSFESLTVTLLCKASGITRSTFYLHYSNIMELLMISR